MEQVEKHYPLCEVAERLGVSKRTVKRQIVIGAETEGAAGLYPVIRIGRALLVSESAVIGYAESCRVRSGVLADA